MDFKNVMSKNGPSILFGIGIASIWTGIGLTIRATSKARDIIDEERAKSISYDEEGNEYYIEPTFKEKIKLTWKCFLPPVIAGIGGTAAIVGGGVQSTKKVTALATAATLAADALSDQTEAIKEIVGEEKAKEIDNKVTEKKMARTPIPEYSDAVVSEPQTVLCFDKRFGRYFYSTKDALERLQDWINMTRKTDDFVSVNEAFDRIAVRYIPEGRRGWSSDCQEVIFTYGSMIAPNGQPCIVLEYDNPEEDKPW